MKLLIAMIVLVIGLIWYGVSAEVKNAKEYDVICKQNGGTTVHNGKYLECIKNIKKETK